MLIDQAHDFKGPRESRKGPSTVVGASINANLRIYVQYNIITESESESGIPALNADDSEATAYVYLPGTRNIVCQRQPTTTNPKPGHTKDAQMPC